MAARRKIVVGHPDLRHHAVGDHHEIARAVLDPGGAPVDLDDQPLPLSRDGNPIARPERQFDVQRQAGEQVAQGALQREAEHDRQDAGGGDEAGHRLPEHEGGDTEQRQEIDQRRQQIGE